MAGKGLFRRMLGLCGILLAGIAVGFALLTAVFLLPVDAMEEHVLASIPALSGEWGTGEESYEQVLKGYTSTQLDNSTDAYMLLSAIHRSDKSAVDQAVNVYTWQDPDSFGQYGTLLRYGKSGSEGMQEKATARYWLGYLVVLKPLLLFLNYMDIRMLNMIVQLGLVMLLCCLMQKRGLGRYALPFGLSLLCITPGVTWLSLQFSTTLLVALAAMAVLLWKPQRRKTPMAEDVFFLLTGMATSYFDFLTYPIASLGMPLIVWLLLHRDETARTRLGRMVRCGLCWALGYAGMWAGKWALALLYGSEGFWSTLVGSLEVRMSHEVRGVGRSAGGTLCGRLRPCSSRSPTSWPGRRRFSAMGPYLSAAGSRDSRWRKTAADWPPRWFAWRCCRWDGIFLPPIIPTIMPSSRPAPCA
ncbi:MAG: hypothetical protein ACLUE8_08710 [Lachnospiraceae bacterium]